MNRKNLINTTNELLKNFSIALSKPQFVHFEQIVKGMLFSELKSINSYAKSYSKDQSSLNRFMNSKAVKVDKLNHLLIDLIESKLDSKREKDFIFDDTIKHHKYGKHIFGLGSHHDHLNGGYSIGHSVVTGGIRQGNYFYPTNCELYIRKQDVCESSIFLTKIDIAKAMLENSIDKVDNVLMDSWYSKSEILKFIMDNHKFFFTMLKKDRNVNFNRKNTRQLQEWEKYINPRDYQLVKIDNQELLVYEKIGYLPKVGKVKILFTKYYDSKTQKAKDTHYLCTNNLELSVQEILYKYKDRWPIETFHRDIKQNLGFEKCIIRNEIGVKKHFLLTYISHNILVFINKKQVSCGEIQKELKYSYIEKTLQNYGIDNHNLEDCKKDLMILC